MSAGTIDNYSVALVQRKANWIDKLLKTKSHVFLNPRDENFVDADELLLALTEEWGDVEKAEERRIERDRMKQKKMAEEQNSQRRGHLAALSLLRGALNSFDGDKGSAPYQNRLRKIQNLESALKNNAAFTYNDFLKKNIPFLYAKGYDQIIQKGDIFFSYGQPYEIISLNFKKQKIAAKPLREQEMPSYHPYQSGPIDRTKELETADLKKEHGFMYFSKLANFNKKYILCLDNEQFYTIPDEKFKEAYYDIHLEITGYNYRFKAVRFFKSGTNDDIIVSHYDSVQHNENEPEPLLLNPYHEDDRKIIETRIPRGIEFYSEVCRDGDLALIKSCYPELFNLLPKYLTQSIGEVAETAEGYNPAETLKANTAENFKENVSILMRRHNYKENPFEAVKSLITTASPETRSLIKKELLDMGCIDENKTRAVISSWGTAPNHQNPHKKEKVAAWER
jgi:hypothetical protein